MKHPSSTRSRFAALLAVFALTLGWVSLPAPSAAEDSDPSGDWQGALDVGGQQLRIVFHVSRSEASGGDLVVTMDSPDQGATGIPVQSATIRDGSVRFELHNLGAVYTGTLASATIDGEWSQSGVTLPLKLDRADVDPDS